MLGNTRNVEGIHILKNFWSFVLKFTTPRYTLLFLNFEIYITHVINCEWSRSINFPLHMLCMWYKLVFFHQVACNICWCENQYIYIYMSKDLVWESTRFCQMAPFFDNSDIHFFFQLPPHRLTLLYLSFSQLFHFPINSIGYSKFQNVFFFFF